MSRQRYDNESLPGGKIDTRRNKGPKDTFVPGHSITPATFKVRPKPKLGKEPAAPKPRKR